MSRTLYVCLSAIGPGDGSFEHPYETLTEALAYATAQPSVRGNPTWIKVEGGFLTKCPCCSRADKRAALAVGVP